MKKIVKFVCKDNILDCLISLHHFPMISPIKHSPFAIHSIYEASLRSSLHCSSSLRRQCKICACSGRSFWTLSEQPSHLKTPCGTCFSITFFEHEILRNNELVYFFLKNTMKFAVESCWITPDKRWIKQHCVRMNDNWNIHVSAHLQLFRMVMSFRRQERM